MESPAYSAKIQTNYQDHLAITAQVLTSIQELIANLQLMYRISTSQLHHAEWEVL
jgi:hypothetical protein